MSVTKGFPIPGLDIGSPGMTHLLLEAMSKAGIVYAIEIADVPRFEVTKAGTDDRHS